MDLSKAQELGSTYRENFSELILSTIISEVGARRSEYQYHIAWLDLHKTFFIQRLKLYLPMIEIAILKVLVHPSCLKLF